MFGKPFLTVSDWDTTDILGVIDELLILDVFIVGTIVYQKLEEIVINEKAFWK